MQDLKTQLERAASPVVKAVFHTVSQNIEFEYTDTKFGHFSTNFALVHSKGIGLPPLDIAQQLVEALKELDIVDEVSQLGPGFVNIHLKGTVLQDYIDKLLQDPSSALDINGDKVMAIDYSHPNIGKPMAVHHLLSTVLGDSIKRTYRALGNQVIADNFIGDMGTQFGKLIYAVKTWGDPILIEKNPVAELLKLYVQFHVEADKDDSLNDLGRVEYKKIEDGDPENRALLAKVQQWSMAEVQAIYDFLEVEFDHYNGESFYEDKMKPIIEKGVATGIFTESNGALICKLDNPDEPPALIVKSDGTSLYLTRDLARIAYWNTTWQPDLMVNVVDSAQSLQFRQLFEVADKLQLTKAQNIHVAFGRMKFKDQQMSTRKGNVLLIEDVIEQTKAKLNQNIDSLSKDLDASEKRELVDVLSMNIIKYSVLRQSRQSDVVFDFDTLLSIDGNSAPYLCYTIVRAKSILSNIDALKDYDSLESELTDVEKNIVLEISKLNSTVKLAAQKFEPSDVSHYLYTICKIYNNYYSSQKILENNTVHVPGKKITQTFVNTTTICFSLLGLKIPEKM